MSFQIKKIVLYGKNKQTRTVTLHTDSVNIITGASGTGKSSLIHIVKYCLGSKRNDITLRREILDEITWFGVILVRGEEELFVARRNPDPGKLTSEEIYIEKGHRIEIPNQEILAKNINLDGLVTLLTEFAGIAEYTFEPKEGDTRHTGTANINKALIYCFQQQGEVASQNILFHRQHEPYLPQSIKDYMPFFLGAVDMAHVLNKQKLYQRRRDLRRLEKQEAEKDFFREGSFERSHALIAEAISVGLLPDEQAMPQSWAEVKKVLSTATNTHIGIGIPEAKYGPELNHLIERQRELRNEYRSKSEEITAILALKSNSDSFAYEVNEHRARLNSIGLIPSVEENNQKICPFCLSLLENPVPGADAIRSNLQNVSTQLEGVTNDLPHLEKLIAASKDRQDEIATELSDINSKIQAIQQTNQEIENIRDVNAKLAHVRGRIGFYLETIADIEDVTTESREIEELKNQIQSLEDLLNIENLHDRLESILSIISQEMTEMSQTLDLEYSGHPIRLDPKKLTVVADTEDGPLPLKKMGSGETWMSLHIITHLALHRWFAKKGLPVPHFVFFDQPTQAYFPPDATDQMVKNSDRESVMRMFRLITDKVKDAGFQVIIPEHADIHQDWYQELVIENWWDGENKLVPPSWIV